MALVREQTAPSFFDLLAMWQAARSFVYGAGAGQMTRDEWSPYDTTVGYSAGVVNSRA